MKPDILMDFDGIMTSHGTLNEKLAERICKEKFKTGNILPLCHGLLIRYYLGQCRESYENNVSYPLETDKFTIGAYDHFEKILTGCPIKYIEDFAHEHSYYISREDVKAIENLNADHKIIMISAGMKDITEILLNDHDVSDCFEGIISNELKTDSRGRVCSLKKNVTTPMSKVDAARQAGIKLAEAVSVGHDCWETELMKETYPIALGARISSSAYRIAKERGAVLESLSELPFFMKSNFIF